MIKYKQLYVYMLWLILKQIENIEHASMKYAYLWEQIMCHNFSFVLEWMLRIFFSKLPPGFIFCFLEFKDFIDIPPSYISFKKKSDSVYKINKGVTMRGIFSNPAEQKFMFTLMIDLI